jgi:hypothetical protein
MTSYTTRDEIKEVMDLLMQKKDKKQLSQEDLISKVYDLIDMKKCVICPPGKWAVISCLNPNEAFT